MKNYRTFALIINLVLVFFLTKIDLNAQQPKLFIQTGHEGSVLALVFSPNGKLLATGGLDSTIRLWNVETGEELRNLIAHTGSIESVAFSPDNKILASGSRDKTIKLWDVQTGKVIKTLTGHTDRIKSLSFSSDGKLLASVGDDVAIKIWDPLKGIILRNLPNKEISEFVGFNPDNKTLITVDRANLKIWETATGKLLQNVPRTEKREDSYDGSLTSFSPENKIIALAIYDNKIELRNSETGKLIRMLSTSHQYLSSISLTPDGKTLVSRIADFSGGGVDGNEKLEIWDVNSGKLSRTLTEKYGYDGQAVFSPDGQLLAGGSNGIRIRNLQSGKMLKTLSGHTYGVDSVDFSSDGKYLASAAGNGSGSIKIWGLQNGTNAFRSFKKEKTFFNPAAFSPDGQSISRVNDDSQIELWNVADGTVKTLIGAAKQEFSPTVFSLDGKSLAYIDIYETAVDLIDLQKGYGEKTFSADAVRLTSIAFSPDSKRIAAGTVKNTIALWDVKSGQLLKTLAGHSDMVESVVFSPNGRFIASGSYDKTIKLWNAVDGRLLLTLRGHTDVVSSVAFSPDGKTLVSGSNDRTIKFWDPINGKLLKTLSGHTAGISNIKFSPNGKFLASGSYDSTAELWDPVSGKELCSLIAIDKIDWLVVTPEGLFDGSPEGYKRIIWRLDNDTLNYKPVETYFKDFHYPDLLKEIMAGKNPVKVSQ